MPVVATDAPAAVARPVLDALHARNFRIHPDWTAQCAAYLNAMPSPPRTTAALVDAITHQFLHSDIADMGLPSLPPNIADAHRVQIGQHPHPIVLQVNEVHEVGVPVNAILEAIAEFKPKKGEPPRPPGQVLRLPRKMLRVILSDGHQQVTAMEYVHLPGIALDSPVGMKVAISGATIRRGILVATPANFNILGGQVAALNEHGSLHRLENNCRRALGMDDLPPPDPAALVASQQHQPLLPPTSHPPPPGPHSAAAGSRLAAQVVPVPYQVPSPHQPHQPRPRSRQGATATAAPPPPIDYTEHDLFGDSLDFDFDDDELDKVEFDAILAVEAKYVSQSSGMPAEPG
ncbi:hypothetical protein HDU86_006159 [Geranomyces michiganensis]|nr:hypothetical protein HDU86_006159 [Geranomyces michiganensis]